VKNAGFRKANTALLWATCWAIVRETTGQDPTVEEVADWWKTPYRTAYREQAAFRAAFPALDTPAALFQNDENRAKIAQAAARGMAGSGDTKKSRKSLSDLNVLQVGMTPATI
jgi:hypothetical protein